MDSPVCASQAAQAASWPWTRPLLDFQAPFVSTLPHAPSDALRNHGMKVGGREETGPPGRPQEDALVPGRGMLRCLARNVISAGSGGEM